MNRSQPNPSRLCGQIREWNAMKRCGFVDDGTQRIFLHSRDFAERHKTPETGDTVFYSVGTDRQGRPCAKNVVHASHGGRVRGADLLFLLALLVAPGLLIHHLAPQFDARILSGWIVASLLTYGVYAVDKKRAREGRWRIKEGTLHLLELCGGWPGAFIAQRQLRHKTSKMSYQLLFWFIVALHQFVAIDWQLGWRITHRATQAIEQFVQPGK